MEQKIQILKNTLVEIKQNLANLKEKSDAIGKIIDAGEIISKDAVGELKAILENYQQLELRLHEIGKDLDLNFGTKLEDIYETITSYEQKFRYDRIKEIIIDYFRLNSETAEIKSSLEHSKLMLIEKCASSIELLEKDIEPYELVVSTVKESSELPIEKYASIINDIDFTIALATFKGGLLFFDDSIDVSQYTISLPLTYRKTKTDENTKATKGSSEVNSKSVELSQFIMPRRWSNFGGYVSDVKVSITEITESPSLEEIKTLEKENKDSLIVLWNAANEKLIPVETTEHTTSRIFSHETIELLRNYGLLTDITIADINGSKHFLTLSAKGWMCFTNSYIKNYLYNREVPLSIPNTLCISSEDWTPLFASRTALVHDCCRKRNQNYVLWKGKPSEIVFAKPTNQAEIMMIAGLLQEYAEENDLNEMANNLNLLENDSIILIVVRQHNDIAVLANELNALVSRRIKVFFAAADKRFAVFNSDGISAELPKMSTIDYSGDDTTALKEPPHNDHSEKFNAKHLTAVNKVKTNSPSASKFKKEILDLLKRFSEVRTILPLFTHLGILELDQIFRFGVCLECFSDDVVTKRKVFDAIDLLCTKGLLAHLRARR